MPRLAFLGAAAAAVGAAALASTPAHAGAKHRTGGSTGLGLGAGTFGGGISVKHFTSDRGALQGVVGTAGYKGDGLYVSGDYLLEQPVIGSADVVDVAWNIGAGAGLGVYSGGGDLGLGVSGVAGLEFALVPIPLDFVIEYRPTLGLSPDLGLDLVNFTGHLRWFF